MSASTEKKLRKAAREAGNDKKAIALEKEMQEKAKQKRRWTMGTIAVVVLIALILLLNSGILYKSTALTVGDEDFTASEVSYQYANQFYYMANQYGSYSALFGLDTSGGINGLDDQPCPMLEEGSWRDYFLDAVKAMLVQEKALLAYAAEQGIELSAEELAEVEASFEGMDAYAASQGYASADKMLAANYGAGVNTKLMLEANNNSVLATKALSSYTETLEYSDAELKAQYQSYNGDQDIFDYAYYWVAAETTEVEGEDGETSTEVSAEAFAAAQATAEAIMADYAAAEGEDFVARLNEAVAAHVADASAYHSSTTQGVSLGEYKEWLMASGRQAGDITVIDSSSEDGSYVVIFIGRDNNDYNLAQVRHILVKAVADENGEYTEAAKAEAKAKAEDILAEFKAGDKSEESFAALAEQYSEDGGSNTNGGLYDNVVKGQMVEEFDAFCFDEHAAGDTAIVYGESTSYAGYHVMYYVGEGENYANSIALADLQNADVAEWLGGLTESIQTKDGFGLRFVG